MSDTLTDAELEVRAEAELRAKYTDAQVEALGKEGKAFKNPDGHYSFPVDNATDLDNAIQALGRAPEAVRDAVKAYIVKRAGELKLTAKLPDDWRAAAFATEKRLKDGMESCDTCAGTGEVENDTCMDCGGSGEVQIGGPEQNSVDADLEKRKRVRAAIDGTVERRDFAAEGLEIRETSDGGLRFSGYASTTETPYKVGGFTETFARGAFRRCLGEDPDVVLLVNHDGLPLARTRSGTMTLSEDTRGLKVDADLDPDDPDVQALVPKMKRGDLTEMSFAFRATDDQWSDGDTKRVVRSATIHKGDVSMVTHGANQDTSGTVAIRSAEGLFELRIDEDRVGKKHSAATVGEIDAAIVHLQKLKSEAEPNEPALLDSVDLGTPVPSERSSIDADKARRASTIARAA